MIVLAALLTLATPAQALDCVAIDKALEPATREISGRPGTHRVVQITTHESLCGGWTIIDVWQDLFARSWSVQRRHMNRRGELTTTYLDLAACPAFLEALTALDAVRVGLQPLGLQAPLPKGAIPPPPPPEDGTTFGLTVMGAVQPGGWGARVSVKTSTGPLADWVTMRIYPLEECWGSA